MGPVLLNSTSHDPDERVHAPSSSSENSGNGDFAETGTVSMGVIDNGSQKEHDRLQTAGGDTSDAPIADGRLETGKVEADGDGLPVLSEEMGEVGLEAVADEDTIQVFV
jgi:hypothetical protein